MPQIFLYALKHVKDLHGEKQVMKGSYVLKTCLKRFTIVNMLKRAYMFQNMLSKAYMF